MTLVPAGLRLPRGLVVGALLLPCLLGGCGSTTVVLHPSGYIAILQRNLVIASTILMLLIIVPVIALTLFFAWRYRAQNSEAVYEPEWNHSTQLEVLIWSVPLAIIIALGAITWLNTHTLDPYRPLAQVSPGRPVAGDPPPKALRVDVVALDWKWLFFYPDLGIASVNDLAAPVNVPIDFDVTSATVMNSFFIPALAGQIYAMAGMQTQLHAVINKVGDYRGFSANFSGPGFSYMDFTFHGMTAQGFAQWVANARSRGTPLTRASYLQLAKPSIAPPVRYFTPVDSGLYKAILNMCVRPGTMCESDIERLDAKGGVPIPVHGETGTTPGAPPHPPRPALPNMRELEKGAGPPAPPVVGRHM